MLTFFKCLHVDKYLLRYATLTYVWPIHFCCDICVSGRNNLINFA